MSEAAMDLPEDLWELVFRRIDDESSMEAVSLTCRRFLAITNRTRSRVTISNRISNSSLARLFRRFPNLRRINVADFEGDLDCLFREIARSGLQIEVLDLSGLEQWFPRSAVPELGAKIGGCLKALNLDRFFLLENDDVLAISNFFPNLEELDISNPQQELNHTCHIRQMITDYAIAELSSKLRNLRSIRLSGNHFLSDNALISLAENCPLLTEIVAYDCSFMKGSGIAFAIRQCRYLASVSVNKIPAFFLGHNNIFFRAIALRRLSLTRMAVTDELLISIGEAGLQLLELSLSNCSGLTFTGLLAVLQAYGWSLHCLVLVGLEFLSDENMTALVPYLVALGSIDLSYCYNLSNITFFSILKNCSFVEKIEMRQTNLGQGHLLADMCSNLKVRHLNLSENAHLDDNTIHHIAEVCPRLQSLDIQYCIEVTGEGLKKIWEICSEVTEINMVGCSQIRDLGCRSGFQKLETLLASWSGLEDKALLSIAISCKRLLRLELSGCWKVTEKGVKEIVRECKKLRQLQVDSHCVDISMLSWIVVSRPFLRRIQWESGTFPSKVRSLFLRHGCMVSIV